MTSFKLSATGVIGLALTGFLLAATAAQASNVVEFRLGEGETKGRAVRQAENLGAALGATRSEQTRQGTTRLFFDSNTKASAAAYQLRERRDVAWAQVTATEKALANTSVPDSEYAALQLSIQVRQGADVAATLARIQAQTGSTLKLRRVTYGNRALVVVPTGTSAAKLAAVAVAAEADADVLAVDRLRLARHQWVPNDQMWSQQWSLGSGVGGIRAPLAWDQTPSGSVTVAVIDTGIRSHADLDNKRVPGYDLISNEWIANDGDGRDDDETDPGDYDEGFDCSGYYDFMSSWHGTHVAGIIGASTNNGAGIAGVAPNARIQSVRVLGRCGGTTEDVADAIRWAAGVPVAGVPTNPQPSKVLNLSLGGYGACSENEQDAINSALARGASVVVAAGNDAMLARDFSPANCKGVITVGASQLLGDLSSYSNFGLAVSITAPGGDGGDLPGVLSTLNGGITQPAVPSYASYSGTSMAAPHVAGVVALMLARDPSLTPAQVINRLQESSRDFPQGSDCASVPGACGSGLLDAANAVNSIAVNRVVGDVTLSANRLRLVEVRDSYSGRYQLTGDIVELQQLLTGVRGGNWQRTGYSIETFSYTSAGKYLAIPQPVCKVRLKSGAGAVYSANIGECQAYIDSGAYVSEGIGFLAALPNGTVCPEGSGPAYEFTQNDAYGTNIRVVADSTEVSRLLLPESGWARSRVAFCVPSN